MVNLENEKNLLIISHDKIGIQMAGPGIRYHYMAEELSKYFNVTIGFFDPTYLPGGDFKRNYKVAHIDAHQFEKGFTGQKIVVALWLSEAMMDYCNRHNIYTVFDMYAPVPVENLASSLFSGRDVKAEDDFEYKQSLLMYRKFFENGDLFLCSNRRQLDYWTGYVFGADQVRPSTYARRPFFDRMIYAPMGIDTKKPLVKTKDVIKGVIPGIGKDDIVLLWTGGIWGWYDGKILIEAMKKLDEKRPEIKLVFFGTKHPNPAIPEMKESLDTRKLSENLGLTNKNVFFMDGWVDYDKRIDYLLEADVAINTHKPSIETEFSHRTRVLDHILAELPTIGTEGDYLSDDIITRKGLGIITPSNDVQRLEQAILDILEPETYKTIKKSLAVERPSFDWSETLRPLIQSLLNKPARLGRLPSARPTPQRGTLYKLGKRYIPLGMKKAIIRTLRYGK